MLPKAEFWNPNNALPSGMRDAITLFEQEMARRNGHVMTPGFFGFVGMMERDLESLYDLLLATPENIDSESNF